MSPPYDELKKTLLEVGTLTSVGSLLSWDQETMMPPKAAGFRAEELAMISSLAHRRFTDPRVGDLLAACEENPELLTDPVESANLREIRRDYERARKLPTELVAEMSETSSRAMEAWKHARKDSDFETFRPWLEKQVRLNRQKAECYGAPEGGDTYDALMEDFEPGMRDAELEQIFTPLREALTLLIGELTSSPHQPDCSPCTLKLPIAKQRAFNHLVAEQVGYDFKAGRLDTSAHPFTDGLAPGDTRITTRYSETGFMESLYSTLHEAGHALYEQGLPKNGRHGQPLSQAIGLGIHESQSRMWENQVGRSRAFWQWALPLAKKEFGAPLDSFEVDDYYRAVNFVQPSLVRTGSDEVTYNLHIMLRFHIERALIRGDLPVADVPAAWNERIKLDLGLDVPDDRHGCLQDIHWSAGSLGYFPTYTLGNLYAAQLWESVTSQIPDLDDQMARGEFGGILEWLRMNIHRHGRRYAAHEICTELTGRPLDHEPLVRYLEAKLKPVYQEKG